MTFSFKNLIKGMTVKAIDADAGKIKDILFDDLSFEIRYFVIDTGKWLPGRKVILSPDSLSQLNLKDRTAIFSLTKEKIKESPALESELPVSRQHEELLNTYYGWTPYWKVPHVGSAWFPYPGYTWPITKSGAVANYPREWAAISETRRNRFDQNLRSLNEVCGYRISSKDDKEFGEVSDAIFDDEGWILIDLVLSSRKWLPGGKKFICSPLFVTEIDEINQKLSVSLNKDTLVSTPEYQNENYNKEHREAVVRHYLNTENGQATHTERQQHSNSDVQNVF